VVNYGTGIKHAHQCTGQTVDESAVMSPTHHKQHFGQSHL